MPEQKTTQSDEGSFVGDWGGVILVVFMVGAILILSVLASKAGYDKPFLNKFVAPFDKRL
ncbi:hypothetical protein QVM41_18365 [Pseudomonas shirazica]|uniref:hypothetical protein n=1 Tax=Pseudomonas shirazica TaxID=1940636 RepID=UPI00352483E4